MFLCIKQTRYNVLISELLEVLIGQFNYLWTEPDFFQTLCCFRTTSYWIEWIDMRVVSILFNSWQENYFLKYWTKPNSLSELAYFHLETLFHGYKLVLFSHLDKNGFSFIEHFSALHHLFWIIIILLQKRQN